MENIRAYCEYIDLHFQAEPNQEKQDNYYIEQNKCLDAVSNKLLSMDDANKRYYAKMIADYFENRASIDFDLLNAFRSEDNDRNISDDATLCVAELVWSIAKLFAFCGLDINQYMEVFIIPGERPVLSVENVKKKIDRSTAKNQYGILCALIKASGHTIPDGKKIASFISWLCGGSVESIRQNVCCKYDFGDERILKEKFASIGITYEEGKIKNT